MLFLLVILIQVLASPSPSRTPTPLNSATIYIDGIGNVTYKPESCSKYCPPTNPGCGCLQCNLTTLEDCSFTDFYQIRGIIAFYTVPPEKACDRDTITVQIPSLYHLTIDKYGAIYRLSIFQSQASINNTISVLFTLGYSF